MEIFKFKLDRELPEDFVKYNPSYGKYWETLYEILGTELNSKGKEVILYCEKGNPQNYGYTQKQFIQIL